MKTLSSLLKPKVVLKIIVLCVCIPWISSRLIPWYMHRYTKLATYKVFNLSHYGARLLANLSISKLTGYSYMDITFSALWFIDTSNKFNQKFKLTSKNMLSWLSKIQQLKSPFCHFVSTKKAFFQKNRDLLLLVLGINSKFSYYLEYTPRFTCARFGV